MLHSFPALPFELHLTTAPLTPDQLAGFEVLCHQVGGKALLIELARGQHCLQPMLSLIIIGTDASLVLAQAQQLAGQFGAAGYPILRLKMEVPAWGAVLVRLPQTLAGSTYYEWHGRVNYERAPALQAWCEQCLVHLSANTLRQQPDVRFVTLREFGPAAQFAVRVATLRAGLAAGGWKLTKQQAEFCFFDSRVALDAGWLSS